MKQIDTFRRVTWADARPTVTAVSPRTGIVGLAGLLGAAISVYFWTLHPHKTSDFSQVWAGALALRAHQSPYTAVGPGCAFDYPFALFYPLPAVYVALPFSWLPLSIVDPLFTGLGAAALAYVLTRERLAEPRLLVFASFAFLASAQFSQWTPLLTAAVFLPWLAPVLAAKPTLAIALWLAYPSWWALIGGGALVLLSVALHPWWVGDWLAAIQSAAHVRPLITLPGGPLLLAALWKWRDPHARLILALACVPLSPFLYEAIPLFLIPKTWEQATILALGTVAVFVLFAAGYPYPDYVTQTAAQGTLMIWCLSLPALVMVLKRSVTSTGRPDPAGESP